MSLTFVKIQVGHLFRKAVCHGPGYLTSRVSQKTFPSLISRAINLLGLSETVGPKRQFNHEATECRREA